VQGSLIRRVFYWLVEFIAPYTVTQIGTAGNTAQSLFCMLCTLTTVLILHGSYPGNGIKSLTVISIHTLSLLFTY
jgi:hypothetical protein